VGLLFAFAARAQFQNGVSPWGRELFAVLSFEALIAWPVALYFYMVHPDWSWMYFVDPRRLPMGMAPLILLGNVATLLSGYVIGWALLRARRDHAVMATLGALCLLLLIFTLALSGRILTSSTFTQFHLGRLRGGSTGRLGWSLWICGIGTSGAVVSVFLHLREQGKRPRP
jgi:hypothetical protein